LLAVRVRTDDDTVSIVPPRESPSPRSSTAADQLICTAAMAHLMAFPEIDEGKGVVTGSADTGPWRREGSSTTCPRSATPVSPSTATAESTADLLSEPPSESTALQPAKPAL
jgi:hypothetical protein